MRPDGLFIPCANRLPENRGAVVVWPVYWATISRFFDKSEGSSFLNAAFVANWLLVDDG
jgi:hypothetical protein